MVREMNITNKYAKRIGYLISRRYIYIVNRLGTSTFELYRKYFFSL